MPPSVCCSPPETFRFAPSLTALRLWANHQADEYKAAAKDLLTSERGHYHRSTQPIEPEAVFGDIKQNHGFKRFKLKSNTKVKVEFGLVALAHNLRKYIAVERMCSESACSCL